MPAANILCGTFAEAFALKFWSRGWLRDYGQVELSELPFPVTADYTVETMRLTSYLTNIMPWRLFRRSVYKISRGKVHEDI